MMPAGTYYIGDLCYVMHDEWDEFCDITIPGNSVLDGEFQLADGRKFATYSTMYGDGCYDGLGVDAGLIGCILLSDIDQTNKQNDIKLGRIVTFETDFETDSISGVIRFGNISIDTSCDYDYDDYCGED